MKFLPKYQGNAYTAMTLRLLTALVLLFVSRILIYFFNYSLFQDISVRHLLFLFFSGLRFDLFTLAVLNLPYILLSSVPFAFKYQMGSRITAGAFFYILNILGISVNFIDVIYYRFTQKRMTIDIFSYVNENGREIISLIPDFLQDFWLAFVLWLITIALLIWISIHIRVNTKIKKSLSWKNYLFDSLKFIVIAILFVIISRGGLQNKPINIINAGEYTQPKYFPVILNTPFTIIKTKDETSVAMKDYFNGGDPGTIYTPVNVFERKPNDKERLNVVIIILESFSAEYSGFLNTGLDHGRYMGYTPFLDSLMQQSLTFKGFANGEKSIDGIPAIISGIPSLLDSPFLTSPYASNDINSVSSVLKASGYSTSFFHGGTNGTMGFEAYTKIAGFDNYYGRNEFDNDSYFDGNWGIFDEEFLQFSALKTDQMKEPFLTAIFTLSSHHPYTIPEKYKGKFPDGPQEIQQSIGYADYALRRFFERVSQSPWFGRTLFVLTADHTHPGYYSFYKNPVGRYQVPMIFYHANHIKPEYRKNTVQHSDIFPSILDYLNINAGCIAFGYSVFQDNHDGFAASYNNKTYQLIQGNFVFQFDGEKGISLYDFESDSRLTHNLITSNSKVAGEMELFVKAIVQQFNNRMIRNDLIIRN